MSVPLFVERAFAAIEKKLGSPRQKKKTLINLIGFISALKVHFLPLPNIKGMANSLLNVRLTTDRLTDRMYGTK